MLNQLLLGAAFPFLGGVLWYIARRGRAGLPWLIGVPAAMAISALWAIAPDIPRLLGLQNLYLQLMNDPRCDIFFWHYSIDRQESFAPWYGIGWAVMLGALIWIALRELHRREEGMEL